MGDLTMQWLANELGKQLQFLQSHQERASGAHRAGFRPSVRNLGGFFLVAVTPLWGLLCLAVAGPTPLQAQTSRALRVTGTIDRTEFNHRGIQMRPVRSTIAFRAEIDDRGRWSISGESLQGAHQYQLGFDGSNTYSLDRMALALPAIPSSDVPPRPEGEQWSQAAVYPGNEFPFRASAWSHLEWFVLSSFEYQQRSEKAGHVPSLLQWDPAVDQSWSFNPFEANLYSDPLALALKVRSTFRAEWPRFVERAEFILDPRGIPRQPFGLKIPTDVESAQEMDARWKSLLAKSPGECVGRLTSSEPKTFGARVLPTRYRLEMTWRFSGTNLSASMLDNPMARIDMNILQVQDLTQGVDRPRLPATAVEVVDYRFRRVSRDSVMESLIYTVKDGRWRSQYEFGLRFSAALDHLSCPRIVRVGDSGNSLY